MRPGSKNMANSSLAGTQPLAEFSPLLFLIFYIGLQQGRFSGALPFLPSAPARAIRPGGQPSLLQLFCKVS
tara:strand:+ start:237 stop:449 length:213 start_codon:yes stop_codon:yes gene_type:complete